MNKWDSENLNKYNQPRLAYKDRNSLEDSEMKEVFDSIVSSERGVGTMSNGSLPGPFNTWLYADAEMAKCLDKIGIAVRKNTKNVSEVIKEFAICIIAAHFRSNVEFWAHSKGALKHGVSVKILDNLKNDQRPIFKDNEFESTLSITYEFVKEYLILFSIKDESYDKMLSTIGSEKGMVEFVLVISHYVGLAAQLNIMRIPNPGPKQIFTNKNKI